MIENYVSIRVGLLSKFFCEQVTQQGKLLELKFRKNFFSSHKLSDFVTPAEIPPELAKEFASNLWHAGVDVELADQAPTSARLGSARLHCPSPHLCQSDLVPQTAGTLSSITSLVTYSSEEPASIDLPGADESRPCCHDVAG
jgi:hypothetical protein